MSVGTTTGPDSGKASHLATDFLLWEEFLMADCPGRDGTWPCALGFGHPNGEEDHTRFLPDPVESEVLSGVRKLREDRDALLTACKAALNDRMYDEWPDVADLLMDAIRVAEGR